MNTRTPARRYGWPPQRFGLGVQIRYSPGREIRERIVSDPGRAYWMGFNTGEIVDGPRQAYSEVNWLVPRQVYSGITWLIRADSDVFAANLMLDETVPCEDDGAVWINEDFLALV
jgi:hypothetical protein